MGLGTQQINHLKEENCFAIEMNEVISNKDTKTEIKEVAQTFEENEKMKIVNHTSLTISKETSLEIKDNNNYEELLHLLKLNSNFLLIMDSFLEDNSLLEDPLFSQTINVLPGMLLYVMNLNSKHPEMLTFNIILSKKINALIQLNESEASEHNSTDYSSEGNENNENT